LIALEPHPDGVVVPVKALPGSRQNGIRGEHDGALKVSVTQVAEKGKANKALVFVLVDQLQLRKQQIELISGETSSRKRFLVRGVAEQSLRARIDALLAGL
jgi:uncharacterized protein (TIGR00251 family)